MPPLDSASVVNGTPPVLRLSYGAERANTYVIADEGRALVIDACSEGVEEELKARGLVPDYLLLTHEHCDHLWGVNAIRARFPGVRTAAHRSCSEALGDPKRNKAKQYHIYATLRFGESYRNEEARNRGFSCDPAEIVFWEELRLSWHGWKFVCRHAPGHSPGSILIHMEGVGVFSGDSILREDTFLEFDGGDEEEFRRVTLPLIRGIPYETVIFPGHGEVFRMKEWSENE